MEEHDEVLERIQRKHSSWGDKNFADYSAMETLGDVARLLEGRKIPDVESFEILIRSLQECDQYKHSFADALGQSNSSSIELNSKKKRKLNDKKGNSSDDEAPKIGVISMQKKKVASNKVPFVPPGTILANFGVPESSIPKAQGSAQPSSNSGERVQKSTHVYTSDNKATVEPVTMDVSVNKDTEKLFTFFDQVRKKYVDESRIIVQIYMDIVGKYVNRKIDYLACTSMLQYLFRENPQLVAQSLNVSDIDYYVDSNGSILTLASKDGQYLSSYMQKSAVYSHNAQLTNCRKRISSKISNDPHYRDSFLAAQAAAAIAAQTVQTYSTASSSAPIYKPTTYAPYIPPRTVPPVIPRVIPPNTSASTGVINNQVNRPPVVPPAPSYIAKPVVPDPVVPEDFREYLAAVKAAVTKEMYHKFLDAMIGIRNNFKDISTTPRLQYEAIRSAKGLLPEKVKHFRSYLDKFSIEV